MKNIILGGIVGGVILVVWGMAAWMILPIHNESMRTIPNEESVIAALQSSVTTRGIYEFPGMPKDLHSLSPQEQQAAMDAWTAKRQRGPMGLLIYDPRGSDPFMMSQFVLGFIISVISALIAAWFLSRSTALASSYVARVAYCGMLGIFISFTTHLPFWNWMGFPPDHTTAMIIDTVLGWIVAGLGIAAIVKAPKQETA